MSFAGSEVQGWRRVVENGKRTKSFWDTQQDARLGCSRGWKSWVCGGNIGLTSGCTIECWLEQ